MAALFSEGKVVHGTLPEYNGEHVLVQTEPLVLTELAFERYRSQLSNDRYADDETIVDALSIDAEFIDRYDQRRRNHLVTH